MAMSAAWWRLLGGVAPWFLMEALLPGAARFALVLWLSQRFVRQGLRDVRQHAFAAVGQWTATSVVRRNWWSCNCVACACAGAVLRGLRRCCYRIGMGKRSEGLGVSSSLA